MRAELEARLALAEIEMKTRPERERLRVSELRREAQDKGFGLIARKASALLK